MTTRSHLVFQQQLLRMLAALVPQHAKSHQRVLSLLPNHLPQRDEELPVLDH